MHQHDEVEGIFRESYWPETLMVLGIVFMVASFWGTVPRTLIGYIELLRAFALFAFAGNLLPFRWTGARLAMERFEWFLFNLLVIGPFITGTLLWVNFLFTGPEQLYRLEDEPPRNVRLHWLHSGELPPAQPFRAGELDLAPRDHVLGLATGALGYPVIQRWGPAAVVMREEGNG